MKGSVFSLCIGAVPPRVSVVETHSLRRTVNYTNLVGYLLRQRLDQGSRVDLERLLQVPQRTQKLFLSKRLPRLIDRLGREGVIPTPESNPHAVGRESASRYPGLVLV